MMILYIGIIFFIVILLVAIYYLSIILKIVTGYASKNLCSAVFISNRTVESVLSNELNFSIVKYVKVWIDREENAAYSTIIGLAKRKAVYRPGLGCSLVFKGHNNYLTAPLPNNSYYEIGKHASWPGGDLVDETAIDNVDYTKLNLAVESAFDTEGQSIKNTRAVLVIYKGQIISEKYASGFDQHTPQLGWSLTKSLTNAMVGILVGEGKVSLDDKGLFKEWSKDGRKEITIHHLMNMTSGLQWDEKYRSLSDVISMLYLQNDKASFALKKPLRKEPGTSWTYSSGTTNIVQKAIRNSFGSDIEYWQYPYQKLFSKIGMTSTIMEVDNSGTFIGSSYGYATPRDWARFGLLYLHDGVWNGERILPTGWVKFSSSATEVSSGEYGSHFWCNSSFKYPTAPRDMFLGQGYQGQRIFIIPSKEMVIVRMGISEDGTFNFDGFLEGILSGIKT